MMAPKPRLSWLPTFIEVDPGLCSNRGMARRMPKPIDVIRAECQRYPEAEKAFLFGDHEVYRVKKKVFVWLGDGEKPGSTYVSVKLKETQGMALTLPFVTPSGYGMAKWGWINAD